MRPKRAATIRLLSETAGSTSYPVHGSHKGLSRGAARESYTQKLLVLLASLILSVFLLRPF